MSDIHNNSDVGITCTQCGAMFTGQARYSREVSEMFISHWCRIHEITVSSELPMLDVSPPSEVALQEEK